eukprot:GHVP01066120.1.p4 GENE.GHVP01066120.1~~GHVP01066120.1.p4  ORF type:complete len:102 (+),score=24.76 GHVP01066120.1:513-818(+)
MDDHSEDEFTEKAKKVDEIENVTGDDTLGKNTGSVSISAEGTRTSVKNDGDANNYTQLLLKLNVLLGPKSEAPHKDKKKAELGMGSVPSLYLLDAPVENGV